MPYRLIPDAHTFSSVTHSRYTTQSPFILTPSEDHLGSDDVQYVIRGGRVVRQQPPVPIRPLDSDAARKEVAREDDEILR